MTNLFKLINPIAQFKDAYRIDGKLDTLSCNNLEDHSKPDIIQNVAIFGSAEAREDEELFQDALEVSKALAELGYTVIDGGGPGVMKAATVGAKSAGGRVIGVTLYPKDMDHFEGRDPKNEIDEEIITTTYVERTVKLLEKGQIYVIFNGGTGTISEFGMAWGLARLYFGHHKPLILYGNFWREVIDTFKKNMRLRPEELKVYKIANSPHEVLKAIKDFLQEIEAGLHEHLRISTNVAYPRKS